MFLQNQAQFGKKVARIGMPGWHSKDKVRPNGPALQINTILRGSSYSLYMG